MNQEKWQMSTSDLHINAHIFVHTPIYTGASTYPNKYTHTDRWNLKIISGCALIIALLSLSELHVGIKDLIEMGEDASLSKEGIIVNKTFGGDEGLSSV